MASSEKKPLSIVAVVIDLVLCFAVFTFFYYVLQPHVPSIDPKMVRTWAGIAAGCMTGVFWLALQMGKVVFRAQRAAASHH